MQVYSIVYLCTILLMGMKKACIPHCLPSEAFFCSGVSRHKGMSGAQDRGKHPFPDCPVFPCPQCAADTQQNTDSDRQVRGSKVPRQVQKPGGAKLSSSVDNV